MTESSEPEVQQSYTGREVADGYVGQRFASELMRHLHERKVGAVNRVMRECTPPRTLAITPEPKRIARDIDAAGERTCVEFNEGMIESGRAAKFEGC